jgi:protein phosphatase inhibitor 2
MKVDEPKTPYNYLDPALAEQDELDASLLSEKLKVAQETARRASLHCEESDEEETEPETEEQRAKRLEFEKRRKLHYNEASAIKLARKLIEEEIEENLDDDSAAGGESVQDSNDELEIEEATASSSSVVEKDS